MNLATAKILIVTPNEDSKAYMEDFFERLEGFPPRTYAINKLVMTDSFDFIVFDAHTLGAIPNAKIITDLSDNEQSLLFLLDKYMSNSSKHVVWFGAYYFALNQERCPSANSKFTLFARIREMVEYLNCYRFQMV